MKPKTRVEDVYKSQNIFHNDSMRKDEVVQGRFDRVEQKLRDLMEALQPGDSDSKGVGIALGRPSYISPHRLAPINASAEYIQNAALRAGSALAAYPPANARQRHMPLHGAAVAGSYTAADPSVPTYVPLSHGGTAERASAAYLQSVGELPLTSHRAAPRLGMASSAAAAQHDMQMMDSARRVFAMYDRDGSGDIDSRELLPALRALGLDADSTHASRLISRYDTNSDARLDYVEFTNLLYELREFQRAASRAPGRGAEGARPYGQQRLASMDAGPPPGM